MERKIKVFTEEHVVKAGNVSTLMCGKTINEQLQDWSNSFKGIMVIGNDFYINTFESNNQAYIQNTYIVYYITSSEFMKYGYRIGNGELLDPILSSIYQQKTLKSFDDKIVVVGKPFFARFSKSAFYFPTIESYCDGIDTNSHRFDTAYIDRAMGYTLDPLKVLQSVYNYMNDGGTLIWLERLNIPSSDSVLCITKFGMQALIERVFSKLVEVKTYGTPSDVIHSIESYNGWAPCKISIIEGEKCYPLYGLVEVTKGVKASKIQFPKVEVQSNEANDVLKLWGSVCEKSESKPPVLPMLNDW